MYIYTDTQIQMYAILNVRSTYVHTQIQLSFVVSLLCWFFLLLFCFFFFYYFFLYSSLLNQLILVKPGTIQMWFVQLVCKRVTYGWESEFRLDFICNCRFDFVNDDRCILFYLFVLSLYFSPYSRARLAVLVFASVDVAN